MGRLARGRAGYPVSVSFFWRVAALNAVVFAVGGLLLALSPATVSAPMSESEVAILAAGIVALLALNVLVLRWGFSPLGRLTNLMRQVDIARPDPSLREEGPPEIRVVIATFNAMLERLQQERRAAARIALGAQEAERERVARELHDEIGQSLTAVLMALGRAAEVAPAGIRAEVLAAQDAARSSLEDVRRVAQRLRPESLDDLGLPRAMTTLCRRFEEDSGVILHRRIAPDLPDLDEERELVVYRIAQEALTNVARHSGAARAAIDLEAAPGGVLLRVCDDGRGLGGRGAGSGITGMRERALLVEAELDIVDRAGGGVEVRLAVPVAEMVGGR